MEKFVADFIVRYIYTILHSERLENRKSATFFFLFDYQPSKMHNGFESISDWVYFLKFFLPSHSGPAENKKTFKKWTQ
jgi:hypothetical protein